MSEPNAPLIVAVQVRELVHFRQDVQIWYYHNLNYLQGFFLRLLLFFLTYDDHSFLLFLYY